MPGRAPPIAPRAAIPEPAVEDGTLAPGPCVKAPPKPHWNSSEGRELAEAFRARGFVSGLTQWLSRGKGFAALDSCLCPHSNVALNSNSVCGMAGHQGPSPQAARRKIGSEPGPRNQHQRCFAGKDGQGVAPTVRMSLTVSTVSCQGTVLMPAKDCLQRHQSDCARLEHRSRDAPKLQLARPRQRGPLGSPRPVAQPPPLQGSGSRTTVTSSRRSSGRNHPAGSSAASHLPDRLLSEGQGSPVAVSKRSGFPASKRSLISVGL